MSPELGLVTVLSEVDAGVVDVQELVGRTALGDTVGQRVLAAGVETEERHQAGVEAVQTGEALYTTRVEGDEPTVCDDGLDEVHHHHPRLAPVLGGGEGLEAEGCAGSESVGREDGPGGRGEGGEVDTLEVSRERLVGGTTLGQLLVRIRLQAHHGHQDAGLLSQGEAQVLGLHHALLHTLLVHLHQTVVKDNVDEVLHIVFISLVLRDVYNLELPPLVERAAGGGVHGGQEVGLVILVAGEDLGEPVLGLRRLTVVPEVQVGAGGTAAPDGPGGDGDGGELDH